MINQQACTKKKFKRPAEVRTDTLQKPDYHKILHHESIYITSPKRKFLKRSLHQQIVFKRKQLGQEGIHELRLGKLL